MNIYIGLTLQTAGVILFLSLPSSEHTIQADIHRFACTLSFTAAVAASQGSSERSEGCRHDQSRPAPPTKPNFIVIHYKITSLKSIQLDWC